MISCMCLSSTFCRNAILMLVSALCYSFEAEDGQYDKYHLGTTSTTTVISPVDAAKAQNDKLQSVKR